MPPGEGAAVILADRVDGDPGLAQLHDVVRQSRGGVFKACDPARSRRDQAFQRPAFAAPENQRAAGAVAIVGVKGAKAMVGKLAAMGVYQKADQPRSVGGSKRVPKVTQIRAMAAKLDALGIADALEKLEPIEVANSSVIAFVSEIVDRLVSAQTGSAE